MKKWFMYFGIFVLVLFTTINLISIFPVMTNLVMFGKANIDDSIPLDIITFCKTDDFQECTTSPLACFGKLTEYPLLSAMTHGHIFYTIGGESKTSEIIPYYKADEQRIIFNEATQQYEEFYIKNLVLRMQDIKSKY